MCIVILIHRSKFLPVQNIVADFHLQKKNSNRFGEAIVWCIGFQ